MKYSVSYQIMEPGEDRPYDVNQDEEITTTDEPTWIPSPGDSIAMNYGQKMRAFTVLTRHFYFSHDYYMCNVVMRSATPDEIGKRLKE